MRLMGMLQRRLPFILLLGLAISFFGSLIWSATYFPHGYDWRHNVMSSLAYPPDNPNGYHIAAIGMTISGIFLSLLSLSIRTSLQTFAPSRWTKVACIFFILGGLLITVSALITPGHQTLWGLPKAHAKIAQAGTFSFDLGMIFTLPAVLALPKSKKWVRVTALLLILIPVTTFLISRLLFFPSTTHPHPSLLGSLAFWEWIGSITVYLYTALIVLALNPSTALCKSLVK